MWRLRDRTPANHISHMHGVSPSRSHIHTRSLQRRVQGGARSAFPENLEPAKRCDKALPEGKFTFALLSLLSLLSPATQRVTRAATLPGDAWEHCGWGQLRYNSGVVRGFSCEFLPRLALSYFLLPGNECSVGKGLYMLPKRNSCVLAFFHW